MTTDEFGGVAIEDEPPAQAQAANTDQFGGVAVQDDTPDQFGGIPAQEPTSGFLPSVGATISQDLYQAGAAAAEPYSFITGLGARGKAYNPANQARMDQLMQESTALDAGTASPPLQLRESATGNIPQMAPAQTDAQKRKAAIEAEIAELQRVPAEASPSGFLREAAAQSFPAYGADPNAKNTAAQLGRGVGHVAAAVPTMIASMPVGLLQIAGQTYEGVYTQKLAELRQKGGLSEQAINEEASREASAAVVKQAPALAAYMVGGKLASAAVARLLPAASPIVRAAVGTAVGTGSNVVVGGTTRKVEGWIEGKDANFLPNLEQLTGDVLWGIFHGAGEYSTATAEQKQAARAELERRGASPEQIDSAQPPSPDAIPPTAPEEQAVPVPEEVPPSPEGDAIREQAHVTESAGAPQTAEALREKAKVTDADAAPEPQIDEQHRTAQELLTQLREHQDIPEEPVVTEPENESAASPAQAETPVVKPAETEVSVRPAEVPQQGESIPPPKLRAGENQGDLLAGRPDDAFNLAGETGVDYQRRQQEAEAKARAAVEAKRIADEQQTQMFPEVKGRKAQRAFQIPFAPHGAQDLVDLIVEQGGIHLPEAGNRRQEHDDRPTLPGLYRSLISKSGKVSADDMARILHDSGHLPDGDVGTLWRALEQTVRTRVNARKQGEVADAEQKRQAKQHSAFEKAASTRDLNAREVSAESLQVGDKVKVGTETMEVTAIDQDTHDVTLKDGSKFGIQHLKDGQVIYGEHTPAERPASGGDDPFLFSRTPESPENALVREFQSALDAAPSEATVDAAGQMPEMLEFQSPGGGKLLAPNTKEAIQRIMSRFSAPKGEVHRQQITDVIEPLRQKVKGVNVRVARSEADAPESIRNALTRGTRHEGLVDPETGDVWLFSDHIATPQRAAEVFAHEVVGHYGIERLIGEEDFRRIADGVIRRDQATAEAIGRSYVTDEQGNPIPLESWTDEQRALVAREYVARLAERPETNPAVWRRLVQAIRNALRRLGITKEWSEQDIRDLVRQAARVVQQEPRPRISQDGGILSSVRDLGDDVSARSPFARDIEEEFERRVPEEEGRKRVSDYVAARMAGEEPGKVSANERALGDYALRYFRLKSEFAQRNGVKGAVQDAYEAALRDRPDATLPERIAIYDSEANRIVNERKAMIGPSPMGEKSPTSTKNAVVDDLRRQWGLDPVMEPARREFGVAWDDAMRQIDNAGADGNPGLALVNSLEQKMRPITDTENALLLHREVTLRAEYDQAARDMISARDAGNDDAANQARVRKAGVLDELDRLTRITKRAGTALGRGLNARKMMANENYELVRMQIRAREALDGKQLTPDQQAKVEQQHAAIEAQGPVAEQKQAAADDATRRNHAEDQLKETVKKVRPTPKERKPPRAGNQAKEPAPETKSWIQRQVEAAKQRSEERARQQARGERLGAGIDLEQFRDDVIITAGWIAEGLRDFSGFATRVLREFGDKYKPHVQDMWNQANAMLDQHGRLQRYIEKAKARVEAGAVLKDLRPYVQRIAESIVRSGVSDLDPLLDQLHPIMEDILPGTTRRETMDVFSGYGEFRTLNKDAVAAQLRDLRGQAQQTGKVLDMKEGRAPRKTGAERRTPSDKERALLKEVNRLKKEGNYQVEDPASQLKSALQSIKTRLRNAIVDLATELETGVKPERGPAVERDAEAEMLQETLDRMRATQKAIEGEPGMSEEQRAKATQKAIQRSIDELNRRLEANDFTKKGGKAPEKFNAQTNRLRAERDALRAEFEELQSIDEEFQRQKQGEREAELQKQIDQIQAKLDSGDFGVDPAKSREEATTEAKALAAHRDALNKRLAQERRNANAARVTEEEREAKNNERLLRAFKTRTAQRIYELESRRAFQEFAPRERRNLKLDDEALKAQADLQRLKNDFEKDLVRYRLSSRTGTEKLLDEIAGWRRAFVLSGLHTIGKLTTAAGEIVGIAPIEELAGSLLRQIPGIRQIAERAPRQGEGFNKAIEIKAAAETMRNLFRDFSDYVRKGGTDLDEVYGDAHYYPFEVKEVFGRIHGALKTPARRNEFVRSYEKRLAFADRQGLDITDPTVKLQAGLEAYKDAKRSIFSEDNRLTDGYKRFLSKYNEVDKTTGRVPVTSRVFHTAAKIFLPVIRIPTNIVARTLEYQFGLLYGSGKAALALRRGVETLHPDQADAIMAMMKRGSLGAGLFTLGFLLQNNIGGYYNGKRDDKAVPFGAIRKPKALQDIGPDWLPLLGGKDLPKWAVHNPLLEQLQIGATFARAFNKHITPADRRNPRMMAYIAAVLSASGHGFFDAEKGVITQTPFVDTPMRAFTGLKNYEGFLKYSGQLGSGIVVPALLREVAQHGDTGRDHKPVPRKPSGFVDEFKVNIPVLREQVPKRK